MEERTRRLIDRLKIWAERERGRKAMVARYLGISSSALANIFAGRQNPTSEQTLKIQELLARQRKRNQP